MIWYFNNHYFDTNSADVAKYTDTRRQLKIFSDGRLLARLNLSVEKQQYIASYVLVIGRCQILNYKSFPSFSDIQIYITRH